MALRGQLALRRQMALRGRFHREGPSDEGLTTKFQLRIPIAIGRNKIFDFRITLLQKLETLSYNPKGTMEYLKNHLGTEGFLKNSGF